jgi:hypothetical protein
MGAWRGALLLLCALVLAPESATAQSPFEFDVRVGPAVPLAAFSDVADPGAFLSGTVFVHIGQTASLGLEAGGNLAHSKGSLDTTIFQLTPVVRFEAPLANNRGKAYLLLGAGYYQTDSASPGIDKTHGDLGVSIGAGFLVQLSKWVMAGFDLRYHHLFETGPDLDYLVPGIVLAFSP